MTSRPVWEPLDWLAARLTDLIVQLYRASFLQDYLERNGRRCFFIPSCTEFAPRAMHKYGLWHGLLLTLNRMRYCNRGYFGDYLDFP